MANYNLFDRKINDSLHLRFVRDDNKEQEITWSILLANTKTGNKLVLDSYTLKKVPFYLGDPFRIASGEDMIFHHNLANAILLNNYLCIVHNMQGQIFLRVYDLKNNDKLIKYSFLLTEYMPIGALAYGYQYADFLVSNGRLFILVDAGCQMSEQSERSDHLFRFDGDNKKVFVISVKTADEKKNKEYEFQIKENPFLSIDIKADKNRQYINEVLSHALITGGVVKSPYSYTYLGAVENMDSNRNFSSGMHRRTSGILYFFYEAGHAIHLARFQLTASFKMWYMNDYSEELLPG